MKGITGGIPSYLYVIVALIVGIIMLLMISRYSSVLFGEKEEVELTGGEEEISRSLSEIIQKCWANNRRGLEDDSSICKVVNFADTLKIEEINVTENLDCEKLPNADCHIYPDSSDYDCSGCSSPYFDDTDKIIWLTEPDNTEVKISYHGGSRKIVVVGYPCDDRCMCERDCKQKCIDGLSASDCRQCYEDCEDIIIIPTCEGYLYNGLCWYLGAAGQSCDEVCGEHGSACVNTDWNDYNDCRICEYLTGDTRCRVDQVACDNVNRPRPGLTLIGDPLTEGCHVRRDACPQICDASDPDHQRICVCTF